MKGKFVTKAKVKNTIKLFAVILTIIAVIFGVKNSRKTEEQISTTDSIEENQDGAVLNRRWSDSVSPDYGGIGPFSIKDNDGTIYEGGFCMQYGVHGIAGSYDKGVDAYNYRASMFDIMLNAYYSSDVGEETFYRTKLSKIYPSAKDMNIYSIYYQEQLALWGFGSNNLAYALRKYNSSSAALKGGTQVSVYSDSANVSVSGNKWRIGPFTLNNPYSEFFYLNKGSITFSEDGNSSTISNFSIIDDSGKNVEGYTELLGWNGKFYIEFNHDFKKGVKYNIKFNNMYAKTYRTVAKYFSTSAGNQDVAAFKRYPAPHPVEFNKEYSESKPSQYNMYIVKDGENKSKLAGAEFNITASRDTSRIFYTEGSDHVVTSDEQVPIYNKKGDVSSKFVQITDGTQDVYLITETKAPPGYTMWNQGEQIRLYINKKPIGDDGYEIDSITLGYKDKEVTETADSNGAQSIWMAIDKDGNVVTISDDKKYGSGPANTDDYWVAIQFHRAIESNNVYSSAFAIKYKDPAVEYNLDIDKLDSETNKYIPDAKFNVTYYQNTRVEAYDGKISTDDVTGDLIKEAKLSDLFFELTEVYDGNLKLPPVSESYGLTSLGEPDGGSKVTNTGVSDPPLTFKVNSSQNTRDIIKINEVSAPAGYAKILDNAVLFAVHKTNSEGVYENDANGNYKLNALELLDQNGRSLPEAVKIGEGESINIDAEGKINNENPAVTISFSGNKISIKWYNKSIVGGYNLEFGKTSKSNPSTYVAGVHYDYTSKINGVQNQKVDKETDTSPISLETVNIDGSKIDENDVYSFKETSPGNNKFKVKDYTSELTVHRALSTDKKSYIADYVEYKDTKNNKVVKIKEGGFAWIFEDGSYKTDSKDLTDNEKQNIIAYVEYSKEDKTIKFIDVDEDEKPFDFKLFKTDTNGGIALNNTKFTIKRHDIDSREGVDLTKAVGGNVTTLLDDASLSTKTNNQIDYVEARAQNPKAYVYEIHETNAEAGYINVFKKNDKEIAYIQLMVYEDESGNLKVDQGIVKTNDCTSSDLSKINTYVKQPTINGNTVTLNILNQKTEISINFGKYSKGNSNVLKNGEYIVKFDGEELSTEEMNNLNTNGTLNIKRTGVSVGEHTVEFYEIKAPTNYENIFDLYDGVEGIIVKFKVNEDGSTTLIENTIAGKKYNFIPADRNAKEETSEIEEISQYVDAYLVSGNRLYLKIYDPSYVKFTLHKMLYNGESDVSKAKQLPSDATAKFEITKTAPENELKFSGDIPTDTQTTFFTENKVSLGSTYKYSIIEKDISPNYYRNLIDKNIEVTVRMLSDGKIRASYKITGVDAATEAMLKKFISFKPDSNTNTIDLYIANVPEDFYKVILHKVDKPVDGDPITYPAKFNITKDNNTYPVTTENGDAVISEENAKVEYDATHTYTIVEETPPAGFDKINGKIELNVKFNSITASKIINSATAKYYDENGAESTDVDVSVKWDESGTIPIVELYIPNDSTNKFKFKLIKYESDRKTEIKSDKNIHGAKFDVTRHILPFDDGDKYDHHEMQDIADEGGSYNSVRVFNGVLDGNKIIDTMTLGGGFEYHYRVVETEPKQNYENILKNLIIEVIVKGGYDKDDNTCIIDYSYKVYDISNPAAGMVDCTEAFNKKYPNCIILNKDIVEEEQSDGDVKKVEVISLGIVNPTGYKLRLTKTDTDGNPVDTAIIESYLEDERKLTMNVGYDQNGNMHLGSGTSTVTSYENYPILPETEHTWKIYEKRVDSPYYNIFGPDKYIELKVKMDKQGNLSKSYTIKNEDGSTPSDLSTLLKYIEKVDIVTKDDKGQDLDEPIVHVVIKNPKIYRLKIAKYEMYEETAENQKLTEEQLDEKYGLSGATVTLKKHGADTEETVISNGEIYYETYNFSTFSDHHEYEIKETKTADEYHVNILEGKTIKLNVLTTAAGKVSANYVIYNEDGSVNNELRKYVILRDISNKEGEAPLISIKILNPKTGSYNVNIVKTDESGDVIKKYPAIFSYSRLNSKVGKVDDENDNVPTKNGIATIASGRVIDEKGQKFSYTINEKEAPLGYNPYKGTIKLNLTSIDDNKKLTIDKNSATLFADGENIERLTTNKATYSNGNSVAWYFDDSNDSATITIYVKNTKEEFDLALRKHITEVTNDSGTKTYDRSPFSNLDIRSASRLNSKNTMRYAHTKEAVTVESGDIVTYRIDVFNEADIKGYVMEITDYLQDGLEFVPYTEKDGSINDTYGWEFYDENDNIITNNEDISKAKYAKSHALDKTLLNENQIMKYVVGLEQTQWYSYVEIQCRVVKKPTEEKIFLTNRAEITNHKAVIIDENNNEIELKASDSDNPNYKGGLYPDRDSVPENVVDEHKREMFDYDSSIKYIDDEYYEGYQDDDDKETVTIKPKYEYKFGITKVDGSDNKKEIEGAKFKVEELVNNKYKEIYNDVVNRSMEISEPDDSEKKTVELNKTYTYKITELSSASNYENLLAGKYIILRTYMDSNKKLHKGIYGNNNENNVYNKYGFAIFENGNDYTYIRDSELYDRIFVDIDNSYPPKINIIIPNDIIITGKYKINLKKVNEKTGETLGGIPFKINNDPRIQYTSNVDGTLNITSGFVTIDKNNVGQPDVYKIEEVEEEYNKKGYVLIQDPITLNISKDFNTTGDQYIVSRIGVDYTNSEGTQHEDIEIDKTNNTGSATVNVRTYGGEDIKVDITAAPDGTITIKAPNREKEGEYNLQIHKVYIDNEGVQHSLSGTEFELSGDNVLEDEKTPTTGTTGYTNKINKKITKGNVGDTDVYTIREVNTGKLGIVGLKNLIELEVDKYESIFGYELAGISIAEKDVDGKVIQEGEFYYDEGEESRRVIIKDVELTDGRKADVHADIIGNTIVLTVENRETPGKINVKIKKVMSGTNKAIDGVTFKALDEKQIAHVATTGEVESGIAYLEKDKEINKATSYTYLIDETEIPSTPKNIVKLTDYGINLSFKTKYDEDNGTYIIDKNSVNARVKTNMPETTGEIHEKQKEIAEKAAQSVEVSPDGLNLTITIENTTTTDYGLTIRKADMDTNEEIADAKFTIIEDGKTIAENQTIEEFKNKLASKTGVLVNTTHTYQIYETAPAKNYQNILEKVYIELVIKIDNDGNAAETYKIKAKTNGTNADVKEVEEKIQEYVDSHANINSFIEKDGNKFTLNIPNPKDVVDIDITIQKYQLGDEKKGVNGAEFSIRRADIEIQDEKSEVSDVISAFSTGEKVDTLPSITTSKDKKIVAIDSVKGVEVGKTYYYEITESKVPKNFESRFYQAIVKVTVKEDKTVNAYILAAKSSATSGWDYGSNDDDSDHISVETDGTTTNVKWANQIVYVLNITKRQYENAMPKDANGNVIWTNMQLLSGATFTIVPEGRDALIDHEQISATKTFVEKEIQTDTVYKYTITEDEPVEGYYNVFNDINIKLTVAVDGNGNINDKNTKIDVEAQTGKIVSTEALELARESVGVSVNGNSVDVQIANKKITNKFDIQILKVSDQRDENGKLKGIPNVKFTVSGKLESTGDRGKLDTVRADGYTDANGFLTIPGLSLKYDEQVIDIIEDEVPDGVTKIDGKIVLEIDTSDIEESDSPAVIYKKLAEKVDTNNDGIGDKERFNTYIEGSSQNLELKVEVKGQTVLLTVPNPTTTYLFNMFKQDEISYLLHSDKDAVGAKFDVTYKNDNDVLLNDTLVDGHLRDFRITGANKVYEYVIEEKDAKEGYINVLEGYELHVYIATDSSGKVRETENEGISGATYYNLIPKDGVSQKYSLDEIITNKWVKLTTLVSDKSATIGLYIINPYAYKLQLNKKDKNGRTSVNKATVVAEKIEDSDIDLTKLFAGLDQDYKDLMLKKIAKTENVSEETLTLDKAYTVTSDEMLIHNNVGMQAKNESAHLWRISETDVEAPYVNILKDKYIVVGAFYREYDIHTAEHLDEDKDGQVVTYQYYVIDKDGNDVTKDFADYVEVSTEKSDNVPTVVVTVKDPMIFRMGLYKKVDANIDEPLIGANLTLSLDGQTAEIKDGSYETEMLETEIPIWSTAHAVVKESSTVKGYTNILKDKSLHYVILNRNGKLEVILTYLIDENSGEQITSGEEYNYIMSHVELRKYTTDEGYQAYKVYIENPTSFEFDLTKLGIDKQPLDGTEIRVNSSHSGMHILNGNAENEEDRSHISFIEEDVKAHEIITYTITEVHTKEGAYVNKFADSIRLTVLAQGGEITITKKELLKEHGGDFDELEYFKCYVKPEHASALADGQMQTLVVEMENPPQIEVELIKTTAGSEENKRPIGHTKFTIISRDSHTAYTNYSEGKINYLEEIHEPGPYTVRVYEDEVPNPKYVNILENKYMAVNINVYADGSIISGTPVFYRKDNDAYYDNDELITGEEAMELAAHCTVDVDRTGDIQKLVIHIDDPVKFDIDLTKQTTDSETLEGAEFEIESVDGLFETIRTETDELGKITKRIEMADPGVYEFHVTEIKPAGTQYDNVLGKENMIVAFVKVAENGEISLVADKDGNEFTNSQTYLVKKKDGTAASAEDEKVIREFCTVKPVNNSDGPDGIAFVIENPVQTKVDIIKKQYSSDGSNEEDLDGTRFTVIKNGSDMLLNNALVDEEIEIEEHNKKASDKSYYDIYENRTNADGAYVNILYNRYIRVYTELRGDGRLIVTNSEGEAATSGYFEIYENQRFGPAKKLDKDEYSELYSYIDVWAEKNYDGVYTLNVKVLNPITMKVGVLKKQYDPNGAKIPNVSVTIISENTGDHDITTKMYEEEFSEGYIKPGTYDFIVKENNNPNPRYVNILKDRYAKANVTVAKDGQLTCNNIKFYTDNKNDNYNDDALITDRETLSFLQEMVYAEIDDSQVIQKIRFVIENPVTLKFVIHKLDLDEKGLNGATFDITKYVGDSDEVAKGLTGKDTDSDGNNDGIITFEDGDIMKAGIYRYEITELKPAEEKYVNILDCYDDGSQYKVVVYVKLNLDGTTAIVKDAAGTAFRSGEQYKYKIVNRNDANAEIPSEVTEIVHKYLTVRRTASTQSESDKIDVDVHNTPMIDIDVIKVTKEDGVEKPLAGTMFSAEADDGKGLFEDIPATQDKEYTFKNVTPGPHEFYITESQGVVNGGYINVLEDRYVKVYTTISADGVMKITDNNGNEDEDYFEIYDGQYNNRSRSRFLDRTEYAKIYECVSVEAVKQENGVYKLNLKVNNPERNFKVVLNKQVFGEEDINMRDVEFFIVSSVDNEIHSLETDVNGNVSFEEKRVPVGIYKYLVTETNPSGDEFVNILEKNYILVLLQVNQDGTINLVDANGVAEGNENRYYILDEKAAQNVDFDDTIVDDFVRVETKEGEKMPELSFHIKDPERYNFKLVKRDTLTNENMNGVTFTTKVYGPDDKPVQLVDAETFEKLDISTVTTANIDGMDGVIVIPNILIDKTGTYTYVFHEESTDGLFKYLYKSHAEDITIKIDISVEKDSDGKAIGYKVGQPNIVTGAKYIDDESTLTTQDKAQLVRAEVLNSPIRGNYDLVLNKLDSYTKHPLDGAEFDIVAEKDGEKFELYEDVDDLRIENAIIPDHFTVSNGELRIKNIRITPPPYQAPAEDGTLETFKIILTETKAPKGYMLLDDPIVIEVTTAIDGKDDDAKYVVKSVNLLSGENHGLVTQTHTSNEINIVAKDEYFDLALRKSITSVAYSDKDDAKITEEETENRQPKVYEDDELFDLNPNVTTANYRHVKNHVRVYAGQEVIYTLRVYNEGEIDGYAEEITDHLPEGLEFLPTDKFNTDRGWTYDLNDQSLRTIKTTFLSKENNPNNDRFNAENNLIKALDASTGVIDYKEIEIKCKVSDNLRPGVILTNIAEITESKAENRTAETVDRDSKTKNADIPEGKKMQEYKEDELTDNREDYVPGQEDDDDFEKLIVEEFDLALRKYITAINEDEVLAGKTEEKFTDKVIENTEDSVGGKGTASDDAEGINEGANTNNNDESESANGNTKEVNDQDTDEKSEENKDTDEESEKNIDNDNTIKYDREPRVNVSTLKSGDKDSIYKDPDEPTTAKYEHTKAPVEVSVGDIVTYTLEVFNEGTVDGYASLIKDDIPEGVEFVQYTVGDGSVNDIYRWKMVDENDEEVTDPKKAKYIVSDYLSKDNEKEEFANLIRAFDPETGTRLDSKYVQVQFRVICKQDYPKIITNYAQISEDTDESGKEVKDRDSTTNVWIEGEDDQDIEHIWVTYMDLALRKFITGVTDFKTGVTQVVDTRIPQVDPTALINETGTTAKYEHTKEPVLVHTNDVVIYTLRIFNEGSKDGYATQIKDDLPDGLEYLPDHEINKYYEWSLVDKNDKPVTRLEDAEYAVTNYLSKDNETKDRQNLIKSFDYYDYENDKPAKRETPEYKDIKIAFKVTEPQTSDRILINEAQISEQTDGSGVHREDRDSHPNEWLGEDDEDIEKVRVQYFDLALRKWVTKAIVTQDGKETVFETGHHAEDDPEDVVKVDLKKSKINKVVVKFEYQIRITNEGEIEGYAKEIKDHIPEGLTFDPADNPTWTQLEEDIIVTDELKDTLLKPGESAEVTVVLRWINSGDNLGIKVNIAEISKDYNDYGTRDIDSTPDNFVAGEDDIDDAPVMLAVKTGNAVIGYVLLAVFVGAIVMIGARQIKKINER